MEVSKTGAVRTDTWVRRCLCPSRELLGIAGFKHMFKVDRGLKYCGGSGRVRSLNAEEWLVHPRAPLLLFQTVSADGVKYIVLFHEVFLSVTSGHRRGTTDQYIPKRPVSCEP